MNLLLGALSLGLILGLLALGIFISFRLFSIPDITVDGSITLGGAVAAILLTHGTDPFTATAAGGLAGIAAGAVTGVLQTRCGINPLLSGILVMTALYSVNLHIMGKSNIPLLETHSLTDYCHTLGRWLFQREEIPFLGWQLEVREVMTLLLLSLIVAAAAGLLYLFFRTSVGTAMRASGNNEQMTRALGVNVENYRVMGLAISNGLVGFSGALFVQYQGFADAQMGIGMVVVGLASVIIGEALTGSKGLGLALIGTIIGSILFRQLIAIALRWGLDPNDLKMATALFVFAALVLPRLLRHTQSRFTRRRSAPAIQPQPAKA